MRCHSAATSSVRAVHFFFLRLIPSTQVSFPPSMACFAERDGGIVQCRTGFAGAHAADASQNLTSICSIKVRPAANDRANRAHHEHIDDDEAELPSGRLSLLDLHLAKLFCIFCLEFCLEKNLTTIFVDAYERGLNSLFRSLTHTLSPSFSLTLTLTLSLARAGLF